MNPYPNRRAVLSGASLAGASLAGASVALSRSSANGSAVPAMAQAKTEDLSATLSVRDFGAIGDGDFHALSTRFRTTAAARADYPAATTLSESIDGAAIQAAIDHAARRAGSQQGRSCVHIPAGRYRLSRSIRLHGNVRLIGDGIGVSIIDNQNTPLDAPLIVNADPEVASINICDLSLHGGTHGIRINVRQYVEGYTLERVGFQLQRDKNFECNRLLQVGSFTGCTFAKSPFGVYVGDWTTNAASFRDCSFEDHSRTALYLNGAECVNIYGGRFESGLGVRGNDPTLDLTNAAAVNFHGVYFEGTPPVLLRERRSRDGVTFVGCHFTGSSNPGGPPDAYRFDSDGIVNFGPNDWGTACSGPARMALFGPNAGLVSNGRRYLVRMPGDWHILSEQVTFVPDKPQTVVAVTCVGQGPAAACVSGTLELTRLATRADGTAIITSATYRMNVATSGDALTVNLSPLSGDAAAFRVGPGPAGPNRITVVAMSTDGIAGTLRWTLSARSIATAVERRFEVDLT